MPNRSNDCSGLRCLYFRGSHNRSAEPRRLTVRFKIIVTGWNCPQYVRRSLGSVAGQTDTGYDVCVVDDASDRRSCAGSQTEPGGQAEVMAEICTRHGWQFVANPVRRGALSNQYHAVQLLEPEPADVVVFLDADDRLAHPNVLRRLRSYYTRYRPLLTFGSYRCDPHDDAVTPAMNFPERVVATSDYRRFSARNDANPIWFNHLRTVTYELFGRLTPADFTFADGTWFMACCDTAVMVPCLEMAAGRHLMIPEILYIYTRDNTLSDCRINATAVAAAHRRIFRELMPKAPVGPVVRPFILPTGGTPHGPEAGH